MASAMKLLRNPDEMLATERDELYRAMVRLRKALAAPLDAWIDEIRSALAELRDRFEHHCHVEQDAGPFGDIVDAAPRLVHRLEVLRLEHDDIRRAISDVAADDLGPGSLRAGVTSLLQRLVRHREKGADLLHETYEVDIGGLD